MSATCLSQALARRFQVRQLGDAADAGEWEEAVIDLGETSASMAQTRRVDCHCRRLHQWDCDCAGRRMCRLNRDTRGPFPESEESSSLGSLLHVDSEKTPG